MMILYWHEIIIFSILQKIFKIGLKNINKLVKCFPTIFLKFIGLDSKLVHHLAFCCSNSENISCKVLQTTESSKTSFAKITNPYEILDK